MRYLVIPRGRHIHKVKTGTYPDEETICRLPVHKNDTIYFDRQSPRKIVVQCSECFMQEKERKRQARIDAYYWQINYWGWTKKSKSTVVKITNKSEIAMPVPKEMEIPITRLLTMEEEEENGIRDAVGKKQ